MLELEPVPALCRHSSYSSPPSTFSPHRRCKHRHRRGSSIACGSGRNASFPAEGGGRASPPADLLGRGEVSDSSRPRLYRWRRFHLAGSGNALFLLYSMVYPPPPHGSDGAPSSMPFDLATSRTRGCGGGASLSWLQLRWLPHLPDGIHLKELASGGSIPAEQFRVPRAGRMHHLCPSSMLGLAGRVVAEPEACFVWRRCR
ncbi:hypothetical protein BDA96_01G000500 [Sorghum bicolor]|uniref:Uncharacterized protein n=1 Tax=Sorghum bicolor TaxID=4558 RepID=A0A921RUQ8_SORBI|nr:hypothetical protein BDA96_01G000500 [Sorghum bicolor]